MKTPEPCWKVGVRLQAQSREKQPLSTHGFGTLGGERRALITDPGEVRRLQRPAVRQSPTDVFHSLLGLTE